MSRIEHATVDRRLIITPSPPHTPGIYLVLNPDRRIMYIGMAHDLEKVLYRYRSLAGRQRMRDRAAKGLFNRVAWIRCRTGLTPPSLELLAIARFRPPWNTQHNPRPRTESTAEVLDTAVEDWLTNAAASLDQMLQTLLETE